MLCNAVSVFALCVKYKIAFHPPSLIFVHVMTYLCSVTGLRGPITCVLCHCMKIEPRTFLIPFTVKLHEVWVQSIDISASGFQERMQQYNLAQGS